MQNFTTTLRQDIIENNRIFLPAGNAKFTIIDVNDIGRFGAKVLMNVNLHLNKSYDLTNNETLTFSQMATIINQELDKDIDFISPNLLQFFLTKYKEGLPVMLILVMIMLHCFPKFQKTPPTTKWIEIITEKSPKNFDEFVRENKNLLT